MLFIGEKMHEGCSGSFADGKQIADKVRGMGFDTNSLPAPLEINCNHCNGSFQMTTMLSKCPSCGMVYAVTPCHAYSAEFVMPAGIGY